MDMCDPGPEIVMTDLDNGGVGDNLLWGGRGGWPPLGAFLMETAPALAPASPMAIDSASDYNERLNCATILAAFGASAPAAATRTAIPSSSDPAFASGPEEEEDEIL